MPAITINGLVSGIDTDNIVSGLLDIQQQQIDRMSLRKTEIQRKQAAFSTLESRMLSLRSDAGVLGRTSSNPLTKLSVTASDSEAISATASTSAVSGVYSLTVNSKAAAHQVASQGFADADAEITQGTFEIRLGSGDVKTITIDSNNATLSGLASAINASGAGVSASIVKDSAGGSTPWKLLLTGTKTGADNAISVTNNLAASGGTATKPSLDFLNPVQAAADAEVTLGSGAGAITVSSDTNRFDDLIAGVSFELMQVSDGQQVSLTVARDTAGAVTAVQDFVDSFNGVLGFIDDNSTYNTSTNEGGVFLGNAGTIRIQQSLRSTIQDVVPGANPLANRLSAVGLSFTDNGRLQFDQSKLQDALNGEVDGVDADDVKKLFALGGESTNSGISFLLGSSRTKSSATAYGVDITQAAEQATITGASNLAASTVITSSNRTLSLDLDGKAATVTLSEGTYTAQQLADHIESVINDSEDLPGREIKVSLNGSKLVLTSASYGSSSKVSVTGGTAVTDLGLTTSLTDTGRDVVGSFIVDGQTEVAVGRGRVLSGDPDNENTADLQVQVTLTSSQVSSGVEGSLTVTRGLASALDQVLGDLLDVEDGLLTSIDDGYTSQLESIQASIDRQQATFDRQKESLLTQFQALETAISQMQATGNYLSAQLANLPSLSS
ncbi:MAG: flagellar filament capping protein FliD [Planctomycetaceae bacterium]|nr:flagellar filament capping protein FliD [Planctomycetaceae bacterium]